MIIMVNTIQFEEPALCRIQTFIVIFVMNKQTCNGLEKRLQ